MAQTKVVDIMNEGFEIYIKQRSNPGVKYNELLTSDVFEKYRSNRSVVIEKGEHEYKDSIPYSDYLLVKDGGIVGSIGLYGSKTKDTVLEDCKIIQFRSDEDCIAFAKANSISMGFYGMDLLAPLNQETFHKIFQEKLWFVSADSKDESELWYGIKWVINSDHIFWNEYFSYIYFDKSNDMTSFELNCKLTDSKL